MRMLVNSQYLELADNIKLQFTKKNILFAFDDIECERSTSFDVPATPTNTAIFGFSNINAAVGSGMRTRFSAQMQAGSVAKDGYLYVTKYNKDKKTYNCVFVTGDLLKLLTVREAGKIADYYTSSATATYGVLDQSATSAQLYQTMGYGNALQIASPSYYYVDNTILRPSIGIGVLLVYAVEQYFNIPFTNPSSVNELVYVPQVAYDNDGEEVTTAGTLVRFQDNIPDWDGIDLIKICAYLNGLVPYYDDATGLSFYDFTSGMTVKTLEKVIGETEMERVFGDWTQYNYLSYTGEDDFPRLIGKRAAYTLSNANLGTEQNQLYELPAQPSDYVALNTYNIVGALCYDSTAIISGGQSAHPTHPYGENFFARVRPSSEQYRYILAPLSTYGNIPKNTFIQSLCTASTSLKVTARMTLREYEDIEPKQLFYYDGCEWVWTEAQWSNDVVTLSLSKI